MLDAGERNRGGGEGNRLERGIRWILYDDPAAAGLRPMTWLRPASGLLLGTETTEGRWRRLAGEGELVVACRSVLAPLAPGRVTWEETLASDRSGDLPGGAGRAG